MGAVEPLFYFINHLLVYTPNPNNSIPATTEAMQNNSYSLWYFETQARRNWLMSVLVIFYKYNLNLVPEPLLRNLIRIVMNSLEAQFHQCRHIPTTIVVQDLPRRDMSQQPSLGTDNDDRDQVSQISAKPSGFRKHHDSSIECDETESELVAIPESDLSDSTLQGSIEDGMSEDVPLKSDFTKKKLGESSDDHKKKMSSKSASVDVPITTKSLSEGVRMMFQSAILSPPVNVQKAIVVSQAPSKQIQSSSKDSNVCHGMMMASVASSQFRTISAVAGAEKKAETKGIMMQEKPKPPVISPQNGIAAFGMAMNWQTSNNKMGALGRQQRIIETSITSPATTTATPSSSADDHSKKVAYLRSIERKQNYFGSPETPMSRMDLMSPPTTDQSTEGDHLSPTVGKLEIPTPERLLPVGGKENVTTMVDRVREALSIPDISHLKQENSLDSPASSSRTTSPRKLIKQVALLESPPNSNINELDQGSSSSRKFGSDPKNELNAKEECPKRQAFKKGPFAIQSTDRGSIRFAGSWAPMAISDIEDDDEDDDDANDAMKSGFASTDSAKPSSFRVGEECISERCTECGVLKEEYTDEELGLFIVILGTFIHREPSLASPFLPEILVIVSKVALHHTFSWQYESSTHLPGGSQSVAHQFIRCVLHQMAPNGVFYQIFLSQNPENVRKKFFKCVAMALLDFSELNPASPVHLLMETLNSKKTLPTELPIILRNLSEYLMGMPIDSLNSVSNWATAISGIETLFRRLVIMLNTLEDAAEYLLDIMISVLKIPGLSKGILEPFAKVLGYACQHLNLQHKIVHELCLLNSRAFSKERDKFHLARVVAAELVQCLKFKTNIPDNNLLLLVGIVLQDLGGSLPIDLVEGLPANPPLFTNNTADAMRQYHNDVLEFLADFHTLSKIKNFKSNATTATMGLAEDTLGGVLKGAISQYLSLEMSRGNSKDNRAVARYLPWLYNAPTTLQQG